MPGRIIWPWDSGGHRTLGNTYLPGFCPLVLRFPSYVFSIDRIQELTGQVLEGKAQTNHADKVTLTNNGTSAYRTPHLGSLGRPLREGRRRWHRIS